MLAKFLQLNPAVLSVIAGQTQKFKPGPMVTGNYAAAVLGCMGMPEIVLGGIQSFLNDRLYEEMIRLLNVARGKKHWYKAVQSISRGRGCAASCVDRASEVVAFADSFATAAALLRLRAGTGPSEVDEMVEVDSVADSEGVKIITAAFQNLKRQIWPA